MSGAVHGSSGSASSDSRVDAVPVHDLFLHDIFAWCWRCGIEKLEISLLEVLLVVRGTWSPECNGGVSRAVQLGVSHLGCLVGTISLCDLLGRPQLFQEYAPRRQPSPGENQ